MRRSAFRRTAIGIHDRFLGPHEVPPPARAIFRRLGRGRVAVDCGANVGHVTSLLAGRGAEVYAFEPNPFAFEILARRFDSNLRVHCLQKAVAAHTGRAELHLHRQAANDEVRWSTGSSLFGSKPNVDPTRSIEVETVDLDAFLCDLNTTTHVLKLDVEGAEIEILERLLDTGRLGEIEHVLVEMHDRKIPGLEARGAELRRRLAHPSCGHVQLDWI